MKYEMNSFIIFDQKKFKVFFIFLTGLGAGGA
jgi:hypothetical protein